MLRPTTTELHRDVLQAVQDIGEAFTATLQLQPVLERIIYAAMQLVGGDSGSIMLLTQDRDCLVVTAAVGPRSEIILGQRQPADASIAGQALQHTQPLVLEGRADGTDGPRSEHPREIERSIVARLAVRGTPVGVLSANVHSRRDDLLPDAIQLFRTLANLAAIMIEHARMYEDLRQKEERLERFVDRFLRQAERQRRSAEVSEGRLQEMIQRVVQESTGVAPRVFSEDPGHMPQRLTHREREVLTFIVQGLTNKEIATHLCLSPDTVKNHVVHIMDKLGAQDRTQAAVIAIRSGLVK